ncbi:hypothetical protein H257_14270 [Aphanomyces astaci]|uniref:Uncharacterized protein n=1 Tax=Aphanomyces astaci TaxID=112090 RepID=W4FTI2_APHAT|nr:hypothetical protein H257_14270 [Aphanomyces astaci]ETV70246.1 hypothetical protein H257_14270 [Aphanomyces astaci]|eukprot:XP_009840342.1 hypothetical protein H257_14270 [Aphanomyces astaci]
MSLSPQQWWRRWCSTSSPELAEVHVDLYLTPQPFHDDSPVVGGGGLGRVRPPHRHAQCRGRVRLEKQLGCVTVVWSLLLPVDHVVTIDRHCTMRKRTCVVCLVIERVRGNAPMLPRPSTVLHSTALYISV